MQERLIKEKFTGLSIYPLPENVIIHYENMTKIDHLYSAQNKRDKGI
jgi:hypothetical protein